MKTYSDVEKLIRPNILALKPYSSARDEFTEKASVYLDANENPFESGINRYPDSHHVALRNILAQQNNRCVNPNQIVLGNGSDEIIDMVVRMCCTPAQDNVIITPPTYGMYEVVANIQDIAIQRVFLKDNFTLEADEVLAAVNDNTKLIFICSPNNPSGNSIPKTVIEKILSASNCLVFVDEAYIDFSDEPSWTTRLAEFPNLIVGQTLSKFYGMAGLRLGMAIASKEIIALLNKIKPPYNINVLTQNKVTELIQNIPFVELKTFFRNEREALMTALEQLPIVKKVYPSSSNFLLTEVTDAHAIYDFLVGKSIIVRNRSNQYGCDNCLRFTVGTTSENNHLLDALKNYSSIK
jgi:histidinol-phosphate aminotransferase